MGRIRTIRYRERFSEIYREVFLVYFSLNPPNLFHCQPKTQMGSNLFPVPWLFCFFSQLFLAYATVLNRPALLEAHQRA